MSFSLFGDDSGSEEETKLTFTPVEPEPRTSHFTSMRWVHSVNADDMVGLHNPGSTCYLNSILQTLFNIPAFRRTVYAWEYNPPYREDPPQDESIVLQLQLLFARLQARGGGAESTEGLTTAFGWTNAQMFVQNDATELLRALLEALSVEFTNSPEEGSIERLLTVEYDNYIECCSCDYKSTRTASETNVVLDITGVDSLEGALEKLLVPETLEGDNGYDCSNCGPGSTAKKGCKLSTFPPVLCFSLSRVAYDVNTLSLKKVIHRVTYPTELDMGPYVEVEEGGSKKYELVSVSVHSGSATAGHYYALVKSADTGEWYRMNDTHVDAMNEGEFESTYGVDPDVLAVDEEVAAIEAERDAEWAAENGEDESASSAAARLNVIKNDPRATTAYFLVYAAVSEDGGGEGGGSEGFVVPAAVAEIVAREGRDGAVGEE